MGLKGSRHRRETQYHLHLTLALPEGDWDVAINVGTDDSDDLITYKIAYDFHHPILAALDAAAEGFTDLTDADALPALDFMRSDLLAETGAWRLSDVMDGSEMAEPIASLLRLVQRAQSEDLAIYLFGRTYSEGNGIHDTHMNQGSSGGQFVHVAGQDHTDHNDVWQDGALMVALAPDRWGAYFAAFQQQHVPTDDLGNPLPGGHSIDR